MGERMPGHRRCGSATDLQAACENLIIAWSLQPHESLKPDWLREMLKPIRVALAELERETP